jgi:hypothetical protein
LPTTSASANSPNPGMTTRYLTLDGRQRSYILNIPPITTPTKHQRSCLFCTAVLVQLKVCLTLLALTPSPIDLGLSRSTQTVLDGRKTVYSPGMLVDAAVMPRNKIR